MEGVCWSYPWVGFEVKVPFPLLYTCGLEVHKVKIVYCHSNIWEMVHTYKSLMPTTNCISSSTPWCNKALSLFPVF